MGVLITYDVPKEHAKLKEKMIAKGYSKIIKGAFKNGDKGEANLPNTTLWKNISDPKQAVVDLSECASGLVSIERVIAVESINFYAEIGTPLS